MGDVENQQKTILALEVTEEQKETIYHLFSHNNWDFNESEIKVNKNNERISDKLFPFVLLLLLKPRVFC
jgi:uncharacterized protein YbaP (TraB family)